MVKSSRSLWPPSYSGYNWHNHSNLLVCTNIYMIFAFEFTSWINVSFRSEVTWLQVLQPKTTTRTLGFMVCFNYNVNSSLKCVFLMQKYILSDVKLQKIKKVKSSEHRPPSTRVIITLGWLSHNHVLIYKRAVLWKYNYHWRVYMYRNTMNSIQRHGKIKLNIEINDKQTVIYV